MRIEKKSAKEAGDLAIAYIKYLKAGSALNTHRIFETWYQVSGMKAYTLRMFFKDGRLFVTMNSATARAALKSQVEGIRMRINEKLKEDSLFIKDDDKVGYVEEIILR